ncbi:ras-associated and pleckstrin homology domains-containing protein 1 isoform X2 [Lingula anatina]|uniref:Ras-associated and pleckstrin homology domains-containing protein 1 isoform X2 n=1 Tax=Lingula anatina TaxID=7574 RepID=A0A1S3KFV5_LINAN|nr:ras-associated and pleckstrin homology domains-containing protein 1 isoform X2 [Lingula anatina]|eukprot:XP_013421520.1 ras-associated and pleckstrin homology domains-containing protein 1 isoform X2 [Lingula anatina]
MESTSDDSDVEGQEDELGAWLGQLETLSLDLDRSGDTEPKKTVMTPKADKLDTFRFSIINLEENPDSDLDALLGELCLLETQLSSAQTELSHSLETAQPTKHTQESKVTVDFDQLFNSTQAELAELDSQLESLTSKPTGQSETNENLSDQSQHCVKNNGHVGQTHVEHISSPKKEGSQSGAKLLYSSGQKGSSHYVSSEQENSGGDGDSIWEPQTPSTLTLPVSPVSSVTMATGQPIRVSVSSEVEKKAEERDSVFSEVTPSNSNTSMATMSSGSSGVQVTPTEAEQAARLKSEKIKIALEKIKEASVKKLFVQAHAADGSSKTILVDEKMTCGQVVNMLIAKNHCKPNLNWAVVERMPDLLMERLLEDHYLLVEHLLSWSRDSKNKLMFLQRTDKYELFRHPEDFLLVGTAQAQSCSLDEKGRINLIKEFLSDSTGTKVPEMEGMMYIKAEGKKVWRKHFCILRSSGIYVNSKGKSKSSKDLVCLCQFEYVELYTGLDWKKKYRAPTEFGFALKHPQIQKKCKYIKYLCTEDAETLVRWMTAIRIAKFGKQLLLNYNQSVSEFRDWNSKLLELTPGNYMLQQVKNEEQRLQEIYQQPGTLLRSHRDSISSKSSSDSSRSSSSHGSHGDRGSSSMSWTASSPRSSVQYDQRISAPVSVQYSGQNLMDIERGSVHIEGGPVKRDSHSRTYSDSDQAQSELRTSSARIPVTTDTTRHLNNVSGAANRLQQQHTSHQEEPVTPDFPPPPPDLSLPYIEGGLPTAPSMDELPPPPPPPPPPLATEAAGGTRTSIHSHLKSQPKLALIAELKKKSPKSSPDSSPLGSTHSSPRGSRQDVSTRIGGATLQEERVVHQSGEAEAASPGQPPPVAKKPKGKVPPPAPVRRDISPVPPSSEQSDQGKPPPPVLPKPKPKVAAGGGGEPPQCGQSSVQSDTKPPPPVAAKAALNSPFMADLKSALARSAAAAAGKYPGDRVQTLGSRPPAGEGHSNMEDLPPPPPELLHQSPTPGKKKPPPPPKRSEKTQLS